MRRINPRLPLKRTTENDFFESISTYTEEIRQNFKNLVLTNPGERIGDLNFGVGLRNYLFEATDYEGELKSKIRSQVREYLDIVSVTSIDVIKEGGDQKIGIKIKYEIPELTLEEVLEIFF